MSLINAYSYFRYNDDFGILYVECIKTSGI